MSTQEYRTRVRMYQKDNNTQHNNTKKNPQRSEDTEHEKQNHDTRKIKQNNDRWRHITQAWKYGKSKHVLNIRTMRYFKTHEGNKLYFLVLPVAQSGGYSTLKTGKTARSDMVLQMVPRIAHSLRVNPHVYTSSQLEK